MTAPASDFGDWVPEDSYAPPGDDLSPLAVARRLHEERNFLDRLAGNEPRRWSELTDDERVVAVHLMVRIVAWLRLEGVIGVPREPRHAEVPPESEEERHGLRGLVDKIRGDD